MKNHFLAFVIGGSIILSVVGGLICIFVSQNENLSGNISQSANLYNNILSASNVGIDTLMDQEIVSAKFESLIPTPKFNYDCMDMEEISSLLNTVMDAEFQIADAPTEPIFMMEVVLGETKNGSFAFGVEGDTFVVCIDGDCKYYSCSKRNDYINKLLEIQGRK